jgi:predicted GNAT family N-acyltransferase
MTGDESEGGERGERGDDPDGPDDGTVRVVDADDAAYADALAVRHAVFVDEQGVPESLEVDDHEGEAVHFVGYDDGVAVGAARLRASDGTRDAKAERVAVRADRRGEGWGDRLMDAVEATAHDRGFDRVLVNAQTAVEGFYACRGYVAEGETFEEAGIPHVRMVLPL